MIVRSLIWPCVDRYRLLDIVHADQKLYLVCEFLDVDLKRYMENGNKAGRPITLQIVKVRSQTYSCSPSPCRKLSPYFYACLTRVHANRRVATRPGDFYCVNYVNITRVT